ncbi:methylase involved in ubiquinone/menaquinone biosynthesis [Cylindrospermum stagnale PCC 7417]|uniref:Methylase involved in ubiquinone/menaquinone biosynthesis n=1 Tax=Cylindrospermum stagnale PCC 7417 TaxID=56107 RepID=K9WRC1_9NOST|nr:class I SAM-dependent methyltransferase [Cylindrospermum stagnale]AFZ22940.1 methylase involved in ubiquinone/menaquinone biosynthesis [Cylindrospermum stagnale PCC 7417]
MTQNNLPPVWNRVEKHAVFPEAKHDEIARYNFLANLTRHLATTVSPGNKIAYEKRVRPNFQKAQSRDFETREEVREAMKNDPYYQAWSALRRSAMEMRQQAGRSMVLRQANQLAEKAQRLNQGKDTLKLNPDLEIPHYIQAVDHHCMPGSYYTELIEKDVTSAANYDSGIFVTTAGLLGRMSDAGGKAIVQWLKKDSPKFQPKRILDIGCGLGHNVIPIAQAYPDAEVIAIDIAAPMLRYGHARAQDLGIKNVTFIQMDGANTEFADESFDWIQTTMFLHETSNKTLHRIMEEIYRLLQFGGLTLHIEQPQYTKNMDLYEQFIRDWDAYYNNEPFWSKMHDIDVKKLMIQAGFPEDAFIQIGVKAVNDLEENQKTDEIVEDYGRSPVWNAFGVWKS